MDFIHPGGTKLGSFIQRDSLTPRTNGCSRVQREPPASLRSRLRQPLSRLGKGEVASNPAPRAAASRGAPGLCLPRGASDRHPALSGSSTPMIDTLRPVPVASEMAISKTVAWLNEQLELGNERLLLMDCRPQELYESSHIESAINVAIPGIMLRRLQKAAEGCVKLVTVAPEEPNGIEFVRQAAADGITVSLGHTTAGYDIAKAAYDAGATHTTHLYNGMPSLHHREPSVIGAICILS